MRKKRLAGEVFWDQCERANQTVIAVLHNPASTPSPEFAEALAVMIKWVELLAVRFLTRLGVRDPHGRVQDVGQIWQRQMLSRGFNYYLHRAKGRPFAPYGAKAVWNICVTIKRDDRHGGDASTLADVPDPRDNPPLAAQRAELREIVSRAIAELSPNVRAAMMLTGLQGFSSQEAAAELGTTERAVNNRNFRGREQLRQLLSASDLV